MNKATTPFEANFAATPTAPRFSLADREIGRIDVVEEGMVASRRKLLYPTPKQNQLVIRERMLNRGLLLGTKVEQDASGFDSFVVPLSARSISHEAATEVKGKYAYNDEEMFSDLGKLLGTLSCQGGESPLVLDEVIGRNIAIVEFTDVEEEKILLVPGFETQVSPVDIEETALNCYSRRLNEEFGDQFQRYAHGFLDAYRQESIGA